MKKILYIFLFCASLFSCSIQQMVYNTIAPLPEQKLKNENKKKNPDAGNPLLAFTGETDIKLVAEAFPTFLKTTEMFYLNNPTHRGAALMAGQLYVMYANAFVERPAKQMSDNFYDKKHNELMRAKKFYLRGANYALSAIDLEHKNFLADVFSSNEEIAKAAINKLKAHNVEAVFFGASGILAAIAIEPMDADISEKANGARLMLEKACELNPAYGDGGIWEVLTTYYASAPEFLGGGIEKAKNAYKKALKYSQGKSASTYITYAQAFCVPAQDGAGFDKALKKALAIDPNANPETRFMTILSQLDAKWMQQNRGEFIY